MYEIEVNDVFTKKITLSSEINNVIIQPEDDVIVIIQPEDDVIVIIQPEDDVIVITQPEDDVIVIIQAWGC